MYDQNLIQKIVLFDKVLKGDVVTGFQIVMMLNSE